MIIASSEAQLRPTIPHMLSATKIMQTKMATLAYIVND